MVRFPITPPDLNRRGTLACTEVRLPLPIYGAHHMEDLQRAGMAVFLPPAIIIPAIPRAESDIALFPCPGGIRLSSFEKVEKERHLQHGMELFYGHGNRKSSFPMNATAVSMRLLPMTARSNMKLAISGHGADGRWTECHERARHR